MARNEFGHGGGSVVDCLRKYADLRGLHPAAEEGERQLTYRSLFERSEQAAANLIAADVRIGDVTALMLGDTLEHLVLLCALARVGAVIFSIDPRQPRSAIERNMQAVEAKFLVHDSAGVAFEGVRNLQQDDLCRPAAEAVPDRRVGGEDPLFLNQSSGTTGNAKIYMLTHQDILDRSERYRKAHGWDAEERFLNVSPLYFSVSRASCFFLLQCGATNILPCDAKIETLVRFVTAKRVSYLKLTPSHVVGLLSYVAGKPLLFPSLRAMTSITAPISHAQRLAARAQLTANFHEQYGANEVGQITVAMPMDQDRFPDSVGRLLDGIEAKVVDGEGAELPSGEVGLIGFRLSGSAKTYLNNPAATQKAFRDGWFFPGDMAMLNEQGYIFFKGRADDIINNAGVKVYPADCEQVLLEHPSVIEAAAFGYPHKVAGEVVAACVVTDRSGVLNELQRFCLDRLPPYKAPAYIFEMTKIPKNAAGKILKTRLKEILLSRRE